MVLGILWSVFLALVVRVLYAGHSFVAIWRLTDQEDSGYYWLLTCLLVFLGIETLYIVFSRKGKEWKWISPSVIFYLVAACPTIWFLELDRVDRYNDALQNRTADNTTCDADELVALTDFLGVRIPIKLTSDAWLASLEQMLVFILIIGRWLTPKTRFTHDELSILLFVYLGIGSDIMELLVLFEEDYVVSDENVVYLTLIVWNVSLLQFALRISPTRGSRRRVPTGNGSQSGEIDDEDDEFMYSYTNTLCCCPTEVWGVLSTMVLQDGPFLALRLYVIIKNRTLSYTILFFTLKNLLLLIVQAYRLCVLLCCRYDHLRPVAAPPPKAKKPPKQKVRAAAQATNGKANGLPDYQSRGPPQDYMLDNRSTMRPPQPQFVSQGIPQAVPVSQPQTNVQHRNRNQPQQQYNTPMMVYQQPQLVPQQGARSSVYVSNPPVQQDGGYYTNYGYQ